jgi:Uma2 family endonuclease
MGETDRHIEWLIRLRDILKYRYAGQQVYIAADLLLYYTEGTPSNYVVPDVFVVKDCDPGPRRVFKVWEEPSAPHVVFELTSKSSQREDTVFKPQTYARIGVREYFVYDPTQEYLDPPLRGFRMQEGQHVQIEPDAEGWLWSLELDLKCRLNEHGALVLADGRTGQPLPTHWEGEQRAREAEQRALEAEQRAREASEAEVRRLKEELRALRDQQSASE